jgi:hypothetical protein
MAVSDTIKKIPMPRKKVTTMANPPVVGVGRVWEDRWFGVSSIRECLSMNQEMAVDTANKQVPNIRCVRNFDISISLIYCLILHTIIMW